MECFSYDLDQDTLNETMSNPATPMTPMTPSTPASDQDTDRSGFSVSMDSGIGSPSSFNLNNSSNHHIINVRSFRDLNSNVSGSKENSSKKCANKAKSNRSTEHGHKEKFRRERIKESCDQLRVLLPYIRGRKTDMASILEMCVDYLRIVNLCMPQSLHDQIVEILSKDPGLVPNKESCLNKAKKKKEYNMKGKALTDAVSPSGALAELIEKTRSAQKPIAKDASLSEIANYCDIMGSKRIRLQQGANGTENSEHLSIRIEPTVGHNEVAPCPGHPASLYSKTFTHHEEKTYARVYSGSTYPEGYSAAQQMFNTYASNKSNFLEPTTYRPTNYGTDTSLYHYHPAFVPSSSPQSRMYNTSELVSATSVMPSGGFSADGSLPQSPGANHEDQVSNS